MRGVRIDLNSLEPIRLHDQGHFEILWSKDGTLAEMLSRVTVDAPGKTLIVNQKPVLNSFQAERFRVRCRWWTRPKTWVIELPANERETILRLLQAKSKTIEYPDLVLKVI